MNLPIDVVPNTNPPVFRWRQSVSTINGNGIAVVDHEGLLPPSVETSVVLLLDITKQLMKENALLQGSNTALAERVAAQSELLSKKAETAPRKQLRSQ